MLDVQNCIYDSSESNRNCNRSALDCIEHWWPVNGSKLKHDTLVCRLILDQANNELTSLDLQTCLVILYVACFDVRSIFVNARSILIMFIYGLKTFQKVVSNDLILRRLKTPIKYKESY